MSAEISKLLLKTKVVRINAETPFRFSSGLLSPIYCDHRLLLSKVSERRVIVRALSELAANIGAQQIAGVATAGIPWGAWVAETNALPFLFVRSQAKSHGAGKQIEGQGETGAATAVIEDLISTGQSSFNAVEALKKEEYRVCGVVSIFTYLFHSATTLFSSHGLRTYSLTNLNELLDVGVEERFFTIADAQRVREWQADPAAFASKPT